MAAYLMAEMKPVITGLNFHSLYLNHIALPGLRQFGQL